GARRGERLYTLHWSACVNMLRCASLWHARLHARNRAHARDRFLFDYDYDYEHEHEGRHRTRSGQIASSGGALDPPLCLPNLTWRDLHRCHGISGIHDAMGPIAQFMIVYTGVIRRVKHE